MAFLNPNQNGFFGMFGTKPSSGLEKQLQALSDKMQATSELTKKQQDKYKKLAEFNKMLVDGYIGNLQVVVDVSTLLISYKLAVADILQQLAKFDEILMKDIDNSSIDHIRQLTSESLRNVMDFFQRDVSKIKDMFVTFNRPDAVQRINQVESSFNHIQQESVRPFQGGRFRLRLRAARAKAVVKKPAAKKPSVAKKQPAKKK